MNAVGIDVDRSGRIWLSTGDSFYHINPARTYHLLAAYLHSNEIDCVCIEDKELWDREFKSKNGKMCGTLSIILHYLRHNNILVIPVNPAYTSQTCNSCKIRDKNSRRSKTLFQCVSCGKRTHADINAAKNILERGLRKTEQKSQV